MKLQDVQTALNAAANAVATSPPHMTRGLTETDRAAIAHTTLDTMARLLITPPSGSNVGKGTRQKRNIAFQNAFGIYFSTRITQSGVEGTYLELRKGTGFNF